MLKLFTYDDPDTPVFTYRGNDWAKCIAAARKANISFVELELEHTALRGVDFSGLELSNSNFYGSDLSGSDFTGARLRASSFIRSYCAHTKFIRADLTDATFAAAMCDGAYFTGANLRDVMFDSAVLRGAELTDALLTGAEMHNALLAQLSSPFTYGQFSETQLEHYRTELWMLLYRVPPVASVLAQELRDVGADSLWWSPARPSTAENLASAIRRAAPGLPAAQEVLVAALDNAPFALEWLYSIRGDHVKAELTSGWIREWRTHMRMTVAPFLARNGGSSQEPSTQVHTRKLRIHRKE